MSAGLEQRRTLRFAAAALAKIVELELPADPQSFKLWYVYATGQNQKLNEDIDDILRSQSQFLTSDLRRLYSLHLSSARATSALSTVASKLTDEVGQVVGAMRRQAKKGEFRSNLHRGGTAKPVALSEEEVDTAIRAAKVMGLNVAGVDLLRSRRGPLVLEVNSSPGLEGIEGATGLDLAGAVVDYVAARVRRLRRNRPA